MVHYGQNLGGMSVESKASGTDNAEWYDKLFSGAKGTLTHLKSEIKYVFKAAAISPEANKMGLYIFLTRLKNWYLNPNSTLHLLKGFGQLAVAARCLF